MIKYSSSLLGFYAEVENTKTKECFRVTTFSTPCGVYETDVFRAADLLTSVKDVFAVKPLFVDYPSTLEEAKKSHIRIAELFEHLCPGDVTKKLNVEGTIAAQAYRARKVGILRQLINRKY